MCKFMIKNEIKTLISCDFKTDFVNINFLKKELPLKSNEIKRSIIFLLLFFLHI